MKLRKIKIKNFRCLVDVEMTVEDTLVLVGENNTGKTALLEALKIAIPRNQSGRVNPFDEYDYHMASNGDSAEKSQGIFIELWFREDKTDEWPASLIQTLTEIVQTDPINDIDSIGLRVSSKFDEITKKITARWEFLAVDGQPLKGRSTRPENLSKFFSYVRCFYLSALRDPDDEFSPKSQFWGRILQDMNISDEQKKVLSEELSKLNDNLLKSDPRLEKVVKSFENINKVMSLETGSKTSIQALPLKPWDLLSKSEVMISGRGSDVNFPLERHGQGLKNLAVLFLFQAYIDILLKDSFEKETESILALEEPEAHLHPQAIRSLAFNFGEVKSQKIISTHSPYFIQEIPFLSLRVFRRSGAATKILYIKRNFSAVIANVTGLVPFCQKNLKYAYDSSTSVLTLKGKMDEKEFRDLMTLCSSSKEDLPKIKKLQEESKLFLSEEDLLDAERYVKRIRGEIVFARGWILCEGSSEYVLLKYFAEVIGSPLDQFGVSIIDFQNNGSASIFIALAKIFEIPWIMFCDNDQGGEAYLKQAQERGVTEGEIKANIFLFEEKGMDLEAFLVKNAFQKEYLEIFSESKVLIKSKEGDKGFVEEVIEIIRNDKMKYAHALIRKLRSKKIKADQIPSLYKKQIEEIIKRAN